MREYKLVLVSLTCFLLSILPAHSQAVAFKGQATEQISEVRLDPEIIKKIGQDHLRLAYILALLNQRKIHSDTIGEVDLICSELTEEGLDQLLEGKTPLEFQKRSNVRTTVKYKFRVDLSSDEPTMKIQVVNPCPHDPPNSSLKIPLLVPTEWVLK